MSEYELIKVDAEKYGELKEYFTMRHPGTCESMILSTYIWKDYYDTRYIKTGDGIVWVYHNKDGFFSASPVGKIEHIYENFKFIEKYFNEELGIKLAMYTVDEEAVKELNLNGDLYVVEEDRRYFDYVYDADKLRTLSGKKYHKKKNHLNSFLKNYEGRYEYREIDCDSKDDIIKFLDKWKEDRSIEDEYNRVEYESLGIKYVLENCHMLKMRICAVYIDDAMEAFSIGSYNSTDKTAYIHVEKANPEIRGLYAYINKEFIIKGFPDALYVNREDDMGLEGLRQAKMSYNPVKLVKKYNIFQK